MLRKLRSLSSIVIVAAALASSGCSMLNAQRTTPRIRYQERPVDLLYSFGGSYLDAGMYNESIAYFREVERQHPFSEWARRAILMTAYAQYSQRLYPEAISEAERFYQLNPVDAATPYAYYLKAVCYFEQIVDVGRDQAITEQALAALRTVIQRYPNTDYAADARLKLDMVNDQLAGKELTIGRWYLRGGSTLAAIGRFKTVVDRYQTTSHTPEALYRLVEAYLTLGIIDEARRNGAVLGANYPGDRWYAEAYALLTDSGNQPGVAPTGRRGLLGMFRRDAAPSQGMPKSPALPPPAAS